MTQYILDITKKLLAIDSPSGFTGKVTEFAMEEFRRLGYEPVKTIKGSVIVDLGGKNPEDGVILMAHIDTLGAMVHEIKDNGRLKLTGIGGLVPNNVEAENCKVYTRFGQVYEGCFQLENASSHVNPEVKAGERSFDTMELVLDEPAFSKEEVEKLGIMAGDFVCVDPRTVITEKGYIKSRFLDDKLSVGILMGYAKYLKDHQVVPERHVYLGLTVYEEVGHGAAAGIPACVKEAISVDMGCVGEGLTCTEHQVSICAKDSRGPYNYEVTTGLIQAAKEAGVDFAVDIYPFYGSDVDTALAAGYEVRHGLIGPGVYASHGYERSHKDGVENTYKLLLAYLKESK